ncbi:transposase [Venatoribacter cucullus]|uniref:transposase n=1 Tax=Venatoribacter cucullus TaxID=2661630 RepID=UPI0022403210|nr:transposase [Venatoribacter cucullus]
MKKPLKKESTSQPYNGSLKSKLIIKELVQMRLTCSAYFDRPGTSNGPTEAINGRLEHLRGTALGFRNLTNYIARCLLKSGGFRNQLHP